YGGEEIAILLPATHRQGAEVVAENIRESVQSLRIPHKSSLTSSVITISLGLASLTPSRNSHSQSLIQYADKALYSAKLAGRNRVATV
ncbi:diguanylate cyclase, partial [bacterium]|nr:diguanylate cyclase [bacterium]